MKTLKIIFLFSLIITVLSSCKKDKPQEQSPPSPFSVRLTDAPGPYTAVNVDIQGVEVKGSNAGAVAYIGVNPGIYNLLEFSNGKDTLIGHSLLRMSRVSQIRLILGNRNTVQIGKQVYPLETPSAEQSGLKLQVHQELQPGVAYQILLDFDAYASIVNQGNGTYSLKPVIRTIQKAISGAIAGKIAPAVTCGVMAAAPGGTVYSTQADSLGNFLLQGIPAGTYQMTVTPAAPHSEKVISNISVSTGSTTQVGVIQLP